MSPLLQTLMEALRCLPGVGAKTAQRMALHLLERKRPAGTHLAQVLLQAMEGIRQCAVCRMWCESEKCAICVNPKRDNQIVCVVESPADVFALEETGGYRGLYFVLMGHLSPIDGLGPNELGIPTLQAKLSQGEIQEIILATNPTVEGEATAHFIAQIAKENGLKATRIAYGVPVGGELEYIDAGTLTRALAGRRLL